MNRKLILFTSIFLLFISSGLAQKRSGPTAPPAAKTTTARLLVQGTYEEIYDGVTSDGKANGKLTIKFEVARWLTMGTNEVGNAEFSDLPNGPAPSVSGFVTYQGQVKGSGGGGDSYEATSNFRGGLADQDVIATNPEYTDTGNNFKIRVFINPKIKGKCTQVSVRNGETATSDGGQNGTYFFSASSAAQIDDNDDPAKTADTANIMQFGIELDVEPPLESAANSGVGDEGAYAWRGAITNGSKEAGFKILLDKTKDQPGDDKRSRTTRHLVFEATIIPGAPKP